MAKKNKLLSIKLKLTLVLLAFTLAFIFFEISARIVSYLSKNSDSSKIIGTCKRRDPFLYTSFIPNSSCEYIAKEWSATYKINSLGFRDFEYTLEKLNNTYRILIMGDSFFEGVGVNVEETAGKLLELKLRQYAKSNIEVIQIGTAGWSPLPEYIYLSKFGIKFHPDLVIQTVNVSDFKDEYFFESHLTQVAKEILEQKNSSDLLYNNNGPMFETDANSNVRNSKKSFSISFKSFLTKTFLTFRYLEISKSAYVRRYEADQVRDNQFAITKFKMPKDYEDSMIRPKKYILKNKELLDSQNIGFLLIVYPHGQVINGEEWKNGRLEYGFKRGVTYSNQALENMVNWANVNNIKSFDLLNDMRLASQKQKLFFDSDGHWNRYGHETAANSLYNYLVKKQLRDIMN